MKLQNKLVNPNFRTLNPTLTGRVHYIYDLQKNHQPHVVHCRIALKDKAFPIKCPEVACDCTLDLMTDIRPNFSSKKESKEYSELTDLAAVNCIDEKDRFYCPNPACSALYQFTNLRYDALQPAFCTRLIDISPVTGKHWICLPSTALMRKTASTAQIRPAPHCTNSPISGNTGCRML